MHHQEVAQFFGSFRAALDAGEEKFGKGEFTVQRVRIVSPPPSVGSSRPKRPDPDYDALMKMPEDVLRAHDRQFALMHHQEVAQFFGSFRAALDAGEEKFGKGEFTVQQVQLQPVRLGSLTMLLEGVAPPSERHAPAKSSSSRIAREH